MNEDKLAGNVIRQKFLKTENACKGVNRISDYF